LLEYKETNLSIARLVTSYSNYTINATSLDGDENLTRSLNLTMNSRVDFTFQSLAAPQTQFSGPTPPQGQSTTQDVVGINASIAGKNVAKVIFNWNGTNNTFYDANLKLLMTFENQSSWGENDTRAADFSSSKLFGTVLGPAWISSGKHRGAFSFNGINDQISFVSSPNLDQDFSQMTLAFWMFANTTSGIHAGLVGKGTVSYGTTYHNDGKVYFFLRGASNYINAAVNPGSWHHVAAVFNGTSLSMYIDGILQASTPSLYPSTLLGGSFNVGRATSSFNGSLDDIFVFSRALSSTEVQELASSTLYFENKTQAYLNVNQSLDLGNTFYFMCASNGLDNCTETRMITRTSIPLPPPSGGGTPGSGGGPDSCGDRK